MLHDATIVNHDHRIGNGIENRTQVVFARDQSFFDRLLMVDIEDHAAQALRRSVFVEDETGSCSNPAASLKCPVNVVLKIEPASGRDRTLNSLFGARSIVPPEQGEE